MRSGGYKLPENGDRHQCPRASLGTLEPATVSGFTLLEMLVATVIMGMAVVGLLSNISTSLQHASRLIEHDRAALAARRTMDELLVDSRLPYDSPSRASSTRRRQECRAGGGRCSRGSKCPRRLLLERRCWTGWSWRSGG